MVSGFPRKLPILLGLAPKVVMVFHADLPMRRKAVHNARGALALLLLLRISQSQIAQTPVRQFEGAAPDPHVDAVVEKQHVLRLLYFLGVLQWREWLFHTTTAPT